MICYISCKRNFLTVLIICQGINIFLNICQGMNILTNEFITVNSLKYSKQNASVLSASGRVACRDVAGIFSYWRALSHFVPNLQLLLGGLLRFGHNVIFSYAFN